MSTENGEKSFDGFIPDLVFRLSRIANFQYKFYLVDGYGAYNSTSGTWTGMMGECVKNEVRLVRDVNNK